MLFTQMHKKREAYCKPSLNSKETQTCLPQPSGPARIIDQSIVHLRRSSTWTATIGELNAGWPPLMVSQGFRRGGGGEEQGGTQLP